MSSANIFDLADTWNDAAVAFNGIKLNVTDTASLAASNLLSLQVGGVSRFAVSKTGVVTAPSANFTTLIRAGSLYLGAAFDTQIHRDGAAHTVGFRNGSNAQTVNIYNLQPSAGNYERARMGWAGNVFEIKPEAQGTGTLRTLHISGLPTTDPEIDGVLWNDAGTVKASIV